MRNLKVIICGIFLLLFFRLGAQDSLDLQVILPAEAGWNAITEGENIVAKFSGSANTSVSFSLVPPIERGMEIDSSGNFSWNTVEGMVPAGADLKKYYASLRAFDGESETVIQLEFTVKAKQRPVKAGPDNSRITGISLPINAGLNLLKEGDTLRFKANAITKDGHETGIRFRIEEGDKSSIRFDSLGYFTWAPEYNYVDRFQQTRDKHLFIIAEDAFGNVISEKVVISVFHQNQKPVIQDVLPFYVLLGTNNTYKINNDRVRDPDGDPIVFIAEDANLPEGMKFSSSGKLSWSPSRRQFNNLRREPIKVPFYVEDQPSKDRTPGYLSIEASLQDMPPEITVLPSDSVFGIDENERLHLVFHLSDPNGDEDLEEFGFVADDPRIDNKSLRKNASTQYEFFWMPGYDFVDDSEASIEFNIRFFVLDKSKKSREKKIVVKVNDTEDLVKKDKEIYAMYRSSLMNTLDLMDQLEQNQKALDKELKKAKKGKKNRTLVNIGLGAMTGFSPLISQDNTQKTISVIGGTTTTTLGTLEAKDVIGKSVTDVQNKIKVNTELHNALLSEGTALARRYNTRLNRRNRNFTFDLEKLNKVINSPNLTQLELDGSWENNKKLTDKRLKSIFTEFDIMDQDD